jgi:hypothetical protein
MRADRGIGSTPRYAVGLYRVSTAEQGSSGLGLEAQRASVQAFVASGGWMQIAEYSDLASDKDNRRPGFRAALTRCRHLRAVPVRKESGAMRNAGQGGLELSLDGVSAGLAGSTCGSCGVLGDVLPGIHGRHPGPSPKRET